MSQNAGRRADSRGSGLAIVTAVLRRRQPLDEALGKMMAPEGALARLDPRDRAFARLLATTVLRRLGEIDTSIDACLDRPLSERLSHVRDCLRLGAAQLLFLGTPAHAAVDGSVRLIGRGSPFRGLVNAVLRRIAAERDGAEPKAGSRPAPSPECNVQAWLWDSWCAAYGVDAARAIVAAHGAEPPLDLSCRSAPEAVARDTGGVVLPTGSVRLRSSGPVESLPGYREGTWWVQDAAATLPTHVLVGAFPGGIAGLRVLDACAAPGGKTARLAAAGARVTALDSGASRLARLSENLDRLGLDAEVVHADLRKWRPGTPFQAVLLDAPCTATGTIRRHPDIAWLKRPSDVIRLAALQDELLAAAAGMVAPGGVLVFSTCSLQPEEGAPRITRFLSSFPDFRRFPVDPPELNGIPALLTADGDVRTLPSQWSEEGGWDGFFVARLRRAE
jgi:16S rRNA (cytosine967-C5)-methyltransferase